MKILRVRSRFWAISAVMLASLASTLANNIVTNANFEQLASSGLPADWIVFCPPVTGPGNEGLSQGNKSMCTLDAGTQYKDKPTICISSTELVRVGFVQGKLPVKAGQKLRFSCWVKGENIKTSTNAGAWVRLSFSNLSDPSKTPAAYKSSGFLKSHKATFDWSFLEPVHDLLIDVDR